MKAIGFDQRLTGLDVREEGSQLNDKLNNGKEV